jgi:hypothetical protein
MHIKMYFPNILSLLKIIKIIDTNLTLICEVKYSI